MTLVYFRNDDVRESLDNSLISLTELFIKYQIPICHAVEPANISKEVIDWLNLIKKEHPDLIEIVQHGYSHKLNYEGIVGGKIRKGEFGGDRQYQEQFDEIKKGRDILNSYFGNSWFPAFTFPYGARNNAAIDAVSDAGFKVINGGYSPKIKHQIFYAIGKLMRKRILFGRRVSYNLLKVPKTNLFEIDVSFGFIKKYFNDDYDCEMHSIDYLKNKYDEYKNTKVIGVLFHHRFHNTDDKLNLVEDYLKWLKKIKNIKFVTQEDIYKIYG